MANRKSGFRTKDRAFHSLPEVVVEHDSRPGAGGRAALNQHQWDSAAWPRFRAEEGTEADLTYLTPVSGSRHGRRRRSGPWQQGEGAAYRAANRDQPQ